MQGVRRPHSGKTSAGLSSPREGGAGGRAGETAAHGALPRRTRPAPEPPAASEAACSRRGCERSCQRRADFRPHDDPAPGLQRLGRSEDRPAARSRGRFADGAEVSGRREGVQSAPGLLQPLSALRVPHSPQLLQPEPGPAHRARPQPVPQPRVRAAWPVLTFGPVALSCLRTSPEKRATRRRG